VSALCADSFEPPAFVMRHSAAPARRRQARRYNRKSEFCIGNGLFS
jgi:hypothetical protein